MSDADVDPEELRAQLDEIKTAMGLRERYPGHGRIWLAYGLVFGGFSIALQILFVYPVPDWVYTATWLAFTVVALASLWLVARRTRGRADVAPTPDWWVIAAGIAGTAAALTFLSQPVLVGVDHPGVVVGGYFFGLAIVLAGLGFVVAGTVLKAHRIRRRDRWVFYAGGLWMIAYGAAFPNLEVLRYGGYGIFGVLTIVQALASYYLLGRD